MVCNISGHRPSGGQASLTGGVTSQKGTTAVARQRASDQQAGASQQCSNIAKSSEHSVSSSWNEIESFRVAQSQACPHPLVP